MCTMMCASTRSFGLIFFLILALVGSVGTWNPLSGVIGRGVKFGDDVHFMQRNFAVDGVVGDLSEDRLRVSWSDTTNPRLEIEMRKQEADLPLNKGLLKGHLLF